MMVASVLNTYTGFFLFFFPKQYTVITIDILLISIGILWGIVSNLEMISIKAY